MIECVRAGQHHSPRNYQESATANTPWLNLLLSPKTIDNPHMDVCVALPKTHFMPDHVILETEAPPSYVSITSWYWMSK